MSADVLVGVGAPLFVLIGILAKGFFDRKVTQATADRAGAESLRTHSESGKFDADAAQVIAATTVTLLVPLQAEIAELRQRIDALESENATTKGRLRRAIAHIKELVSWIAEHVPDGSPPLPPHDLGI